MPRKKYCWKEVPRTKSSKENTVSAIASLEKDLLALVALYLLKEADKVAATLRKHPKLAQYLNVIITKLSSIFESSRLVLEPYTDYESDQTERVIVSVCTDLSCEEADRRLDKFDDEYWLGVDPEIHKRINVVLEFL